MDELLIKDFEPLIKSIANKFYNLDKDDLMQAGKVGLINAYKNYKKDSNTKFSTYAYTYIYGEMYNLSIINRGIKTNRDSLKIIKLIEKANIYLTQVLNKSPTLSEISSYLEIDKNILENALLSVSTVLSLDKENEEDNNYYDYIVNNEDNDIKIDLMNSLKTLSEEEQNIIIYRYYNDLTQNETAKILGMSQVKVSRYEQKSLKKLRKIMSYE